MEYTVPKIPMFATILLPKILHYHFCFCAAFHYVGEK